MPEMEDRPPDAITSLISKVMIESKKKGKKPTYSEAYHEAIKLRRKILAEMEKDLKIKEETQ